jgi:hypothetical protein
MWDRISKDKEIKRKIIIKNVNWWIKQFGTIKLKLS